MPCCAALTPGDAVACLLLAQSLGANVVFYNWSFGLFTAAWATLLGLVVPLCYLVAA